MRLPSFLAASLLAFGCAGGAQALPFNTEQLPPALKAWVPWVLDGLPEYSCVPNIDGSQRACDWPAVLDLEARSDGAAFSMTGSRLNAGWLPLPGSPQLWPQNVWLNGSPAVVLDQAGAPALWLSAGSWSVKGVFLWTKSPQSLPTPPSIGVVRYTADEQTSSPPRDAQGAVWLRNESAASDGEPLKLKVFRKLDDDIPPRLTTLLLIEAAGAPQEVVLGQVLPKGFTALTLQSGLPARLDEQGQLRLQTRPGVWQLELVAHGGPLPAGLALPKLAAPWPQEEVWAWQARPELRLAELSGPEPVDARQTQMPEAWKTLPALLMTPATTLAIAESQRGVSDAGPDALSLQRQLWLDFAGSGYTLHDTVSGEFKQGWRLDSLTALVPGQVLVNGEPALITRNAQQQAGVELRSAQANVAIDARLPFVSALPVAGYNRDFGQVSTTLHLPPGWKLIAALGADSVHGDWLTAFSLLDLFLILIAVVASLRLLGLTGALCAAFTLALSWHEIGAVRWAWLHLLAVSALLVALPEAHRQARLGQFLRRWWFLGVLAVALPFFVFARGQLQSALYPALEQPGFNGNPEGVLDAMGGVGAPMAPQAEPAMVEEAVSDVMVEGADAARSVVRGEMPAPKAKRGDFSNSSLQKLPAAVLTQTGPGLPVWQWGQAQLSWQGPITARQEWRALLLPPWATRPLRVLMLLAAAGWLLLIVRQRMQSPDFRNRAPAQPDATPTAGLPASQWGQSAAGLMLALALLAAAVPQAAWAEEAAAAAPTEPLPPPVPALLDELRQRLSRPPACLPNCASLLRLRLEAKGDVLNLRLSVAAQEPMAVPLPVPRLARADQPAVWQPLSVNTATGTAAELRRASDGSLCLLAKPGVQELVVTGSLKGLAQLELPLALPPQTISGVLDGWSLSGIDEQGRASGSSLQLQRNQAAASGSAAAADPVSSLPPLLRVQRRIRLGLDWEVETRVLRDGASQLPVLARIPLLSGERPVSENLSIADNTVQISLAPEQSETGWRSRLAVTEAITLIAAKTPGIYEQWFFEATALWSPSYEGIPAAAQLAEDGITWQPHYRPWPGERLKLSIRRPDGVPGQTVTLDAASLTLTPSAHARDVALQFSLRASQGGPWTFKLPPGSVLTSLQLDGQDIPRQALQGTVRLAVHPGLNNITASLRQASDWTALLRTPSVGVGGAGVNASLMVQLPPDRWLLAMGGPTLGPALLFWGVLLVWLAAAVVLGRLIKSPLKPWHWLLLALGLSQLPLALSTIVMAWIALLAWRGTQTVAQWPRLRFNALQALLVVLSFAALGTLFGAVAQGLLGQPDMMVQGNQSSSSNLLWYQDRYHGALPEAWLLSVSLWWYRALMLVWALWLALRLLDWLRWGWAQLSQGGLWRAAPPKVVVVDRDVLLEKERPKDGES